MGSTKKVTLADIAEVTGISKITVSRAFSNPDKLSPETLEKVLQTASQLGYQSGRLPLTKNIKNKTIGIVNPNMSNPFFSNLSKSIAEHARKAGYSILMFDSYESEEIETQAVNELIEYGVDGIILSVISSDMYYNPTYLNKLQIHNIPVVLLDRELVSVNFNGVYIDNMDSGYQLGCAIKKITHLADKEVVIIAGKKNSRVSQDRVAGLRAALFEHPLTLYHADFMLNLAYQTASELLKKVSRPLVLVGINNQITLGIIQACIEQGLIPGQDVLIYSIDEIPYANVYGVHIPCIAHNLNEISFQAVHMLTRLITNEQDNTVPSKIMIRGNMLS